MIIPLPKQAEPDPRSIRRRMGMSQETFSARFGFNLYTLRQWEQGRRRPDGAARVLLIVIERDPEAVERAFKASQAAA